MIVSTTHTLEGRRITGHLGVVGGEAAVNTNFIRDFFSTVTRMMGEKGSGETPETKLAQAREAALRAMEERALAMGADAVIDVKIQFTPGSEFMLIVSATGTAVKLE